MKTVKFVEGVSLRYLLQAVAEVAEVDLLDVSDDRELDMLVRIRADSSGWAQALETKRELSLSGFYKQAIEQGAYAYRLLSAALVAAMKELLTDAATAIHGEDKSSWLVSGPYRVRKAASPEERAFARFGIMERAVRIEAQSIAQQFGSIEPHAADGLLDTEEGRVAYAEILIVHAPGSILKHRRMIVDLEWEQ